ncbi:PREDICTED: tissue factor pathway inhibitor [Chinchilla lanigera]|uniref:Tissue factor pathway inhibitor n=1 Tax=Chinchilla lanigera TaxID=34839 RepID=A0A8C2W430_CHILA|nr:PREDICTED: tissue factor pathway inhibitor [Chinchilla lanigera]
MIYKMKKELIFWASICLLLSLIPDVLNTDSEEDEDYTETEEAIDWEARKPVFTFCAMKAQDGPCKAMIKRFFYNIFTSQCEEFIYGGCLGNQNQFLSMQECKETCIKEFSPLTKSTLEKGKLDLCFLEDDVGMCRAYITRYFYNNQSRQCEPFVYGGCLGNLNNFESLEECKNTCDSSENELLVDRYIVTPTPPVTVNTKSLTSHSTRDPRIWEYQGPSWCLAPADKGMCRANETRFFYNSVLEKCLPFKYSGCGGNENNFDSKRACVKACQKGFIKRKSKEGLIKTRRRRRKQRVKIVFKPVVKKI